jgi:Putative prokaryotic signal transducing protein
VQGILDVPPPPTRWRHGGGGGSGWTELTRAANDIDAHLLVGRLTEAGVESTTLKDRSAPGAWLYGGSNPWAPVTILVHRLQLEDARLVLAEISMSGPSARPQAPPPAPQVRRHALAWWIAALVLGVILTSIALARASDSLESCARSPQCAQESDSNK